MKKIGKIIVSAAIMAVMAGTSASALSAQTVEEKDSAVKVKDGAAKAEYDQMRQAYLKEADAYKNARQNLQNAKEKFQRLKKPENRAEYETKAKEFLQNSVSVLIRRLEALKNKAENVRGVSDVDRAAILADINKDIDWLKAEQSKLSGLKDNVQLKEEAKTIKNYWDTIKLTFKKTVAKIWVARVNFLISKAEDLSVKAGSKIEELKTAGKNVSKLETWLNDFNQRIKTAKDNMAKASEKIPSMTSANINQMYKEIHQLVNEANQNVRQAHGKLVEVIKGVRSADKMEKTETTTGATE